MKKIILTYITLFILSIGLSYSQKESSFNNNREKTFKSTGFKDSEKGSRARPPDPGGGGGNPIPISSGVLLLGIGLASFMTYEKFKKDAK